MKKIILLLVMVGLSMGVSAQPGYRKKKPKTSISTKKPKKKAANGFKSVAELEEWLEGKEFYDDCVVVSYHDGNFFFITDEASGFHDEQRDAQTAWKIVNGVATCESLVYERGATYKVSKAKKTIVFSGSEVSTFRLLEVQE